MSARTKDRLAGAPARELAGFVQEYLSEEDLRWEDIGGDGSARSFYRVRGAGGSWVVMVQDRPPKDQRGVSENDSFLYIAQHLRGKGVPVPEIYHRVKERGWFLLEDLGDLHLQTAVKKVGEDRGKLKEVYQKVIDFLIIMQVEGRKGFDPSRTHSAPYDPDFMLVWESGYFHFAFLVGYLGLSVPDEELRDELEALARAAGQARGGYFLYRDFQSRNIMVRDGELGFLDFQGARLGPLQYDLASLLLDPYVEMDRGVQEELMAYYLRRIQERIPLDVQAFRDLYPLVALHRNMQVLGAFAFLIGGRGKDFYVRYIPPALKSLRTLLSDRKFNAYSRLRRVVFEEIKGI